jgi:predicted nucleotidyltransferase
MIDIAVNSQAFKKRVVRFFNSPKRSDVADFIKRLSLFGEVLVFGGLLRDIALFGARGFNSDIDLVVDCSIEEMSVFFVTEASAFSRNKFGGYRVEVGGWTVDVWPIRETWAFKHKHVLYEGRESLLLTTITNWDAVAFSFKDKQIISSSSYLECLKMGELEVVLTENPNKAGVLIRVIRAICDKRAKILMPRLLKYLKCELPKWTSSQIVVAQEELLGRVYLSEFDFYNFRDEIFSLQEDLFGSPVSIKGRNFSLVFEG